MNAQRVAAIRISLQRKCVVYFRCGRIVNAERPHIRYRQFGRSGHGDVRRKTDTLWKRGAQKLFKVQRVCRRNRTGFREQMHGSHSRAIGRSDQRFVSERLFVRCMQ